MNPLMDSVLEGYCFALNLGSLSHLFFAAVSFYIGNLSFSKLTVLAKVVHGGRSYQKLEIIKLLFEFQL